MKLILIILSIIWQSQHPNISTSQDLHGAWKGSHGVFIFTNGYFSYSEFTPTEFLYTFGGSWEVENGQIQLSYEFNTLDSLKVGNIESYNFKMENTSFSLGPEKYTRIDDGTQGKLSGSWLFNNRKRNGQLGTPRNAENPRKTMKILSGTRFQWIAYNTETKAFSGTGGGTYTTVDGKYVENIDFFSRDNNRVGASLEFDYEIKGDEWHHQGLSSRGDPIYEIWKQRATAK